MTMTVAQFDLVEGSLAFTIQAGQIDWQNSLNEQIIKMVKDDGFISLEKDGRNQVIFTYFNSAVGRAVVTFDASAFSRTETYSFVLNWDAHDAIELIVNGELKGRASITPV